MPAKKKVLETPLIEEVEKPVKKVATKKVATRKPRAKKEAAPLIGDPVIVVEKQEPERRPDAVYLNGTPQISIVIPAYNEAERIAPTLVEAHAYFASRNVPFEVLVVDDGSGDRTAEIVERMSADFHQLRLIRMDKNSGKGAAVAKGMLEAKGALRLFADADGATPFVEFAKLEEAIKDGADVAFASRALPDSVLNPPQPRMRRTLGKMGNLVIQATNLPGVKDSQCGFKVFTAEAAEAVFPKLTQHRWAFDIEALVIAKRLGLKLKEIAVSWRDQEGSKVQGAAHLRTLWEDLRIRYNALTGAYPKRPGTK